MKIKIPFLSLVLLFTILFEGCSDDKKAITAKENLPQSDEPVSANNNSDLQPPDFTDPELKGYYSVYTAYLKKVVIAIRNKDEAGTMKIFREEGKQFDNRNEMEQKAKSSPEEEQKFTTWLMQSMPLQTEIVQSDYYKIFSEEYYKMAKEKVEAMDKN